LKASIELTLASLWTWLQHAGANLFALVGTIRDNATLSAVVPIAISVLFVVVTLFLLQRSHAAKHGPLRLLPHTRQGFRPIAVLSNHDVSHPIRTRRLIAALRTHEPSLSLAKVRLGATSRAGQGLPFGLRSLKGDRRKRFNTGLNLLLSEAHEKLREDLAKHDLKISQAPMRVPEKFDCYAKYGHITVYEAGTSPRFKLRRVMDFGIAWHNETQKEVQYVMRWFPDLQLTIVEVNEILDFDDLFKVVRQELVVEFE